MYYKKIKIVSAKKCKKSSWNLNFNTSGVWMVTFFLENLLPIGFKKDI